MLVRFHLERRIFHQERPHVIAQSVGMEMTLFAVWAAGPCAESNGKRRTFKVVFVLTCFTMMSARDLSNWKEELY